MVNPNGSTGLLASNPRRLGAVGRGKEGLAPQDLTGPDDATPQERTAGSIQIRSWEKPGRPKKTQEDQEDPEKTKKTKRILETGTL